VIVSLPFETGGRVHVTAKAKEPLAKMGAKEATPARDQNLKVRGLWILVDHLGQPSISGDWAIAHP
jgi:hypothetical protein